MDKIYFVEHRDRMENLIFVTLKKFYVMAFDMINNNIWKFFENVITLLKIAVYKFFVQP